MLVEFFKYLSTPCPRPIREMGYLKEIIGLEARHRRCQDAWSTHLEASRALIVDAAKSCLKRRRVVVLGSGWLFDVPLRELSELFDEVVLVDLLHMPGVRKTVGKFSNVVMLEHDIAGVIAPLYQQVREATPMPLPDADLPLDGADLVVSANVISQLPVIPGEYATKAGRHSAVGLSVLSKALIESHLAALVAFRGTACLITEVEHQTLADGVVVARRDPLSGVTVPTQLGHDRHFWEWDFAPRPERHKNHDVRYQIEGVIRPALK